MNETIRQLRSLEQHATPGPWYWGWRNDDLVPGSITSGPDGRPVAVAMCPRYGRERFAANAVFITAARTALPKLLDLWEAAERLDTVQSADDWDQACDDLHLAVIALAAQWPTGRGE